MALRRSLASRAVGLISAGLLLAACAAGDADQAEPLGRTVTAAMSEQDAQVQATLAQVRRGTARFHRVEAALAAGYELGYVNGADPPQRIITGCISHPTAGAMGYHYFNKELVDDNEVDPLKPEALVYAPGPGGRLELAAVEYVVPGPNSNPPGPAETPFVFGMPMHILVPAVGFHIMHAWVWKHNPAGMFEDWNPDVTCPPP